MCERRETAVRFSQRNSGSAAPCPVMRPSLKLSGSEGQHIVLRKFDQRLAAGPPGVCGGDVIPRGSDIGERSPPAVLRIGVK